MKKIVQIFFKRKIMILTSAAVLSGCPLTVNLNIATDKPISLVVDKPVEVKLDADIAVTQLPPVKVGVAPKAKK